MTTERAAGLREALEPVARGYHDHAIGDESVLPLHPGVLWENCPDPVCVKARAALLDAPVAVDVERLILAAESVRDTLATGHSPTIDQYDDLNVAVNRLTMVAARLPEPVPPEDELAGQDWPAGREDGIG